ncbi:MAG: hypothetical protein WCH21_07310 [Bacteroidota bacterium]
MKNKLLLFFSLLYFYSNAQQNFINVPSAEVTIKNKVFFQQQLNFNELMQSNSTLDFGLGRGFEIGANVLGLNFNNKQKSFLNNDTTETDPYNPLVLINALKQFELSNHASITFGSQFGFNFTDNKKRSRAGLAYVNFRLTDILIKNSTLVLGSYYNSPHYGGRGNRFGAWVGTEIPVTSKFHLMAESVLGNNALCYTSLGVIYYPLKWMPLTLGIQIPNSKNNAYSIVFELTIIPLNNKE